MRHFLLKFNYGVEIGASLAYMGHWSRTKDPEIMKIIMDESEHMEVLENILATYEEKPSILINLLFNLVGEIISFLCKFSPLFMLNWVARTMEAFAVFNYRYLASKYPGAYTSLTNMAESEERHKEYFK